MDASSTCSFSHDVSGINHLHLFLVIHDEKSSPHPPPYLVAAPFGGSTPWPCRVKVGEGRAVYPPVVIGGGESDDKPSSLPIHRGWRMGGAEEGRPLWRVK